MAEQEESRIAQTAAVRHRGAASARTGRATIQEVSGPGPGAQSSQSTAVQRQQTSLVTSVHNFLLLLPDAGRGDPAMAPSPRGLSIPAKKNSASADGKDKGKVCHTPVMWSETVDLRARLVRQRVRNRCWSSLHTVFEVWCCVVKHGLVTLITKILKDTETFQVLFIVSLFCAWNITTVEINSGVHLLKR